MAARIASRLRLNGITLGGKVQLATINGKSLAIGETIVITGKPPLTLRLLKIEKDSVLVTVDGDDAPAPPPSPLTRYWRGAGPRSAPCDPCNVGRSKERLSPWGSRSDF